MRVHLVVLNYNGRRLLAECLPSIERAARRSRHDCDVTVIDNASTDDSVELLARSFPGVSVLVRPNLGLVSFNQAVAELPGEAAILLNNDVRLRDDSIDPLVAPLFEDSNRAPCSAVTSDEDRAVGRCFMTAPLCWRFDGATYEGFKTAIQWRYGLVSATSLYEGHAAGIHRPGPTASAGAVLAVDRALFVELGGFDPLFLPGRLEDLDFAYRGYQAGYRACYVPESVAYHLGAATFSAALGADGCERLARRNTMLFQWKHLRAPEHLVRQWVGLALRVAVEAAGALLTPHDARFKTLRALREARARLRECPLPPRTASPSVTRERRFFRDHHPRTIDRSMPPRETPVRLAMPLEGAAA